MAQSGVSNHSLPPTTSQRISKAFGRQLAFSAGGSVNGGIASSIKGVSSGAGDQDKEKKKKESILDLTKYLDRPVRVKFSGGREVTGILKGYDQLLNLVLDGTTEYLRDPDDPFKLTEDTRHLGLVVCRGTSVVLICPAEGMEAIANPFIQQD